MRHWIIGLSLIFAQATAHAGGTHEHGHASFSVGEPAKGKVDRVFEVSLQDSMRFVFRPDFNELHDGEVIRFNLHNDGAIRHEFSIGSSEEQAAHAAMMRRMPQMKHDDPNAVSLDPGESSSITWRFEGDETVVFACNIPGHFEAGMHYDLPIEADGHGI